MTQSNLSAGRDWLPSETVPTYTGKCSGFRAFWISVLSRWGTDNPPNVHQCYGQGAEQRFSKSGPWTHGISISWERVRNGNSQIPRQWLTRSETLELRPTNLCLISLLGDSETHLGARTIAGKVQHKHWSSCDTELLRKSISHLPSGGLSLPFLFV